MRILVTGSAGLIGRHLLPRLAAESHGVVPFDLRTDPTCDVTDRAAVQGALGTVDGIVHLAAVSRVVDGERDPERCWRVNAEATGALLDLARHRPSPPWFIHASSREVYGQQDAMPVAEDAALRPCNVYARSKVEGERLTNEARGAGLRTAILRFSNVYGDILDHADRVVPAFAHAAARGGTVRVDGSRCTFDFTHVADTVDGLMRVIRRLEAGEQAFPPIHFVGGVETSLGALAELAMEIGGPAVRRVEAPVRSYDVHGFYGDTRRASALLDWRATTSLRAGFARLVDDYRRAAAPGTAPTMPGKTGVTAPGRV